MEKNRIAKRIYVEECDSIRIYPRKRCIDTVNECLRKRGLNVRRARRMVQDRSDRRGFVRKRHGSQPGE